MDPEKTAEVAAQWWMEQLQAEARALGGDVPAAKAERFKTTLKEKLLLGYADHGRFDWLSVDHYPDSILTRALWAAGVKPTITVLPWRTVMRFDANGVRVKRGYSAPWVTLTVADLSEEKP